jgi:phenylpropionate dioxygenase-like ring-hydroxylating dioxygenase large terminal subunit
MADDGNSVLINWPAKFNEVPKEVFHREDVFRRELERIFHGPEWHPVAHVAEIHGRGDFKTMRIGAVPVLVMRGNDDCVRVFVNSCPHRGTQLKTCGRGTAPEIECPYHRWLFDNCGALLNASGSDHFPDAFRAADYGLRKLRSAERHGLVFATCSDRAPPLETYLADTSDYFAKLLGDDGPLKLLGYQKVLFSSNWKEYADNEGYHAPLLHRAFRLLRWQGGKGSQDVTASGHKLIEAELQPSPNSGFLNDPSLVEYHDTRGPARSIIVALFPMTIMVKHLDVINIRFAFPRSVDETEVHYAYFAPADDSPAMLQHRLRQASNLLGPSGLISLEDGAVFNRLHEGSNSFGTVAFQKGVRSDGQPPSAGEQNDEASNLLKWERYRRIMGFERA